MKRQKRKWKIMRLPKKYEDYKRELRENREEIALTGSNKAYWRMLTKLIGKEKASLRRERAIAQQGKRRCAAPDGIDVETHNERESQD